MSHQSHLPEGWARPAGFSHAMTAEGRMVWIAGQLGRDSEGKLVSDDIGGQTAQALANVAALLAEAGAKPEHLVRLGWYVTDLAAHNAAGAAIGAGWKASIGKHFPTITLVQVAALVDPRAMVEIEATAVIPAAE